MVSTLLYILAFLVTVLLLVTVHEWGHYWVAKRLGVKVLRFSVGFGKPLWRRISKTGTEYAVAWVPLGGYVKLLDEREGPVPEDEKHLAFNQQSYLVRCAIVLAGPLINILFALLMFWIVWVVGAEQVKTVIGQVIPQSIAAEAGVPENGQIVAVDGKTVNSWSKIIILLVRHLGETDPMKLTVTSSVALGENHHELLPDNNRCAKQGFACCQGEESRFSPLTTLHRGCSAETAVSSSMNSVKTYTLPLKNWRIDEFNPDLLESLGIIPYHPPLPPVIYKIQPDSPAAKSALKVGDKILSIDDQASEDWSDLAKRIHKHPDETLRIVVKRGEEILTFNVLSSWRLENLRPIGYLGVEIAPMTWPDNMRYKAKLPLSSGFIHAAQDVWSFTAFNFIVLQKIVTGKVSLHTLGGPIAIFETAGMAFQQGVVIYIAFLGVISIMLACMNILPIPGLDGGHLLFFAIEKCIGRPISLAVQVLVFRLGMIALLLLIAQATANDLMRLAH